tara:strand:- start:165 stop:1028 length:864 start_codon:yes stop_codon:yes gene_type:complete
VWGGSGFLGSHVCDQLSNLGNNVTIADIKESKFKKKNQKMVIADVRSFKEVDQITKNQDYVYNFSGIADINESNKFVDKTVDVNINGNLNLLRASVKNKIKRYIFASTVYVYSDSGGFYKCSKQACEKYIEEFNKQFNLNFNILRFGTLYGPRSNLSNSINYFIHQILKNKTINYDGKAHSSREYIHVKDAANISSLLLNQKYKNQHYTITGSQSLKVKETIHMISEILKKKNVKVKYNVGNKSDHYSMTPYSYVPYIGKKFTTNIQIDFGQGIMQLVDEVIKNDYK